MENDREKEKEKMGSAIVTLKKGEGRTVKSGGMWIYDNEIASIVGSFEDGDIVIVHDFDGYPLGKGFINRHSKIRIRLMTRDCSQEVNLDFADASFGCVGIPQAHCGYCKLPCCIW